MGKLHVNEKKTLLDYTAMRTNLTARNSVYMIYNERLSHSHVKKRTSKIPNLPIPTAWGVTNWPHKRVKLVGLPHKKNAFRIFT